MSLPRNEGAVASTQIDWDKVHQETQQLLAPLVDSVSQRWSAVRSEPGRTSARAWTLYSYRTFSLPEEPDAEAIVVGVFFAPSPDGNHVLVRGEIGGEETGHSYFVAGEKQVPAVQSAVLRASHDIGDELGRQTEVLVNGLAERRSPPDYRGECRNS